MNSSTDPTPAVAKLFSRRVVITVLGSLQILSWGSTFYLPAVLARPIAQDTGWPYAVVVAGLSVGLLVAGLVSPRTGRAIAQHGGRPVLASGSVLLALGLLIIGTAQNYIWYFAGWAVLGAGMGAGLYDAAFASLGALYGKAARGAITSVTLFGGFASTVCWPVSAYLVAPFRLAQHLLSLCRHTSCRRATALSRNSATPQRTEDRRRGPKQFGSSGFASRGAVCLWHAFGGPHHQRCHPLYDGCATYHALAGTRPRHSKQPSLLAC